MSPGICGSWKRFVRYAHQLGEEDNTTVPLNEPGDNRAGYIGSPCPLFPSKNTYK